MASDLSRETRQWKTPRRSRFGCRNCKLRKLKCDERKPRCKKCSSFGVMCNFMSNIPDLQPITADTERPLVARGKAKLRPPITSAVWTADISSSYLLNAKCQDFVTRYFGRSLSPYSLNDPNMVQVNYKLLKLAFIHPFLMHASLAVALTYDRHLNGSPDCHRTFEECYHWSRSTILLNERLKEPIAAEDKDPIWGTAASLAILAFSTPDASTPEEAWPLNPKKSSDLGWLRMSWGKMALWHMVNPLRPESLFRIMATAYADMYSPLPEVGTDGVPSALAELCNLNGSSTAATNPYFHAVHALSRTLKLADSEVTTGHSQIFTRVINGPFEDLLQQRDPVALLFLYLWYRKTSPSIWWIELRARVECPSICSYLRAHHGDNVSIQTFLSGGALANGWDWVGL